MAISSDVKLAIYNSALRALGSRRIASLTENREPRRVLDDVWGADDRIVLLALEAAEWTFAKRTVEVTYNAAITPPFGHSYGFDIPSDLVRLASIALEPTFSRPLLDREYESEGGYWFANHQYLYAQYVSTDPEFGFNSDLWTQTFKDYLAWSMAYEACERITNSTSKRDRLERDMRRALSKAKGTNGMGEGVKVLRSGSWVRSRAGSDWA